MADLFEAIMDEDVDAVRACLAEGADPNAPNEEGELPLVLAAVENAVEIARALIDGGADPGATDEPAGWTALHYAVQEDAIEMAELLLAHAKPDELLRRDDRGRRLLAVAGRSNAGACAAKLLSLDPPAEIDDLDGEGCTALAIASREGNVEVLEVLLAHGADPNVADELGMTALMRAARLGSESIVKELLARGADPTLRSREGKSAKDYASREIAGL